ncbi:hypothetical protein MSAN_01460500 [Mycena sanguinolenta]|uniref:Uncharacterized protein n=1 Tax=Mycena sanguinolenta TaxID=230812 RepID=A0A8H7D0Z7_9AGAR|nr:hypothetical protein MSAN_01460500 [Mycena sanguinolenta]
MELQLPTPRELELETLLRQRDTQLSQLNDEVTHLRQHVLTQLLPSTTDPVSLPPALTALLLPHINPTPNASNASTSSSSTTAALTQRLRVLQEENDELYELLKQGETGKLKEEVSGLRRLVDRLNGALRESHQVVLSLSTELDKSYEAMMSTAPRADSSKSHSRSPRNSYHVPLPGGGHNNGSGNGHTTASNSSSSKLPPTGPRAHKKPRLSSDLRASPPPVLNSGTGPSGNTKTHTASSSTSSRPDARTREEQQQSPRHADHQQHRGHGGGKGINNHVHGQSARMEVDEQPRAHARSPEREREREREPREKDKDLRHRDRERRDEREPRDRDGGRRDRRNNGNFGGGGGGRGGGRRGADRGPPPHNAHTTSSSYQGGDRTLKERLGL